MTDFIPINSDIPRIDSGASQIILLFILTFYNYYIVMKGRDIDKNCKGLKDSDLKEVIGDSHVVE